MVKKITEELLCDICGAEAEGHSFFYDRRMDAAGSMENEWFDTDLCAIHYRELERVCGKRSEHRERGIGRRGAIQYGRKVKAWIEMQESIWSKMSSEDHILAMEIENLR